MSLQPNVPEGMKGLINGTLGMTVVDVGSFAVADRRLPTSGLRQLAVGSEEFIDNTMEELGPLYSRRKAAGEDEQYELHDPQTPYISRSTVVGEQLLTIVTNRHNWLRSYGF